MSVNKINKNLNTNYEYISATDARKNFFSLIDRLRESPNPINITIKGKPEVLLISKEDHDSLLATYETLLDSELLYSLEEGIKDIKKGKYRSWKEIKKEINV